ncbi:MAG TPA: twin-arginine translocase subunit TatC [Myxococcota bacterium]|nr:twin-arginine translocase subunit TatC [Myxococcota bacterium]
MKAEATEPADAEMPLAGHLAELQGVLIQIFIALLVAFAASWAFHQQVFYFLAAPVLDGLARHGIDRLQALDVTEGIVIHMKASGVAALLVTFPFIIWRLWRFVAPALHIHEKRAVIISGMLTALFFILGTTFCYTVFLPLVVEFLAGFGTSDGTLVLAPTISNTFGTAMVFLVAFGIIFELPLVMMALGALHLIRPRWMLARSRYFIVAAFIIGAIFTPPEPVSQTLMAVPICLLYFLGVLLAWAGWKLGDGASRRSAVVVTSAIVLFTAGIVGAAVLLAGRHDAGDALTGGAERDVAGTAVTTVEIDSDCFFTISGLQVKGPVLVTSTAGDRQMAGVAFDLPSEKATFSFKGARGAVGEFVNQERQWTASGGRVLAMMLTDSRRVAEFMSALVSETTTNCRGTEGQVQ